MHFLWLIPEGVSPEKGKSEVAQSVRSQVAVYHTYAMRREAVQLSGCLCNIKPAFIQEFYCRCTGNVATSHSSEQAEVDKSITA